MSQASSAADAELELRDTGRHAERYWTSSGTVAGPLPRTETDALAEREQATVADPVPLGFAAFASTMFTISAVYAHWIDIAYVAMAIPVALVFGGITQFLAGMWAFRRGNALVATTFSVIGAFFACWALIEWLALATAVPSPAAGGSASHVIGVFFLTFCAITLYLAIAALGENLLMSLLLLVLAIAFGCDGVGLMIGGSNALLVIGGYAGLLAAILAAYLSAAVVINSALKRDVLPAFSISHTA
jgi:succinate-acetate transporter protein